MAGAVAHQGDQARVRSALGAELIYQGADRLHDLSSVVAFPTASNALAGARVARALLSMAIKPQCAGPAAWPNQYGLKS